MGILLFIVREICLFFSFFWSYFHSALGSDLGWPPHIVPVPSAMPLLNTVLLLSSGATITWAHTALLCSKWNEAKVRLLMTVFLGLLFSLMQLLEYERCTFTISDSVYGRIFYLATGFHGLHVLVGSLFILLMFFRHLNGHFSSRHHFGFEARAWYWHFVDVV